MPFMRQLGDDDEEKKKQADMAPVRSPGGMSQAAPAVGPQQQAGGLTSVPGSQHVNIQDYLKANEGQGAAMAGKLAGGIEGKASQIAGSDPTKAVELGGSLKAPAAPAVQKQKPGVAPLLTGQAEKDAAQDVQSQAAMAGTAGGQQQLLDNAYGSGRSQGESDFDNALMGGGAGGGRLAELSKKYAGLSDMVAGNNAYNAGETARVADAAENARQIKQATADNQGRADATAAEWEKGRPAREAAAAAEAEAARLKKETPWQEDAYHNRWLTDYLPDQESSPEWQTYIYGQMTQDDVNQLKAQPTESGKRAWLAAFIKRIGAPEGRTNTSNQRAAAAAQPVDYSNEYA